MSFTTTRRTDSHQGVVMSAVAEVGARLEEYHAMRVGRAPDGTYGTPLSQLAPMRLTSPRTAFSTRHTLHKMVWTSSGCGWRISFPVCRLTMTRSQ